jgi:hypothetical protein
LALVAVLLRLAKIRVGASCIGAFEEPEEALEPLRQGQLATMLRSVADSGGQVFLVTHSPEVVRAFDPADLVVMDSASHREPPRPLARLLSQELKERYESRLDRAVVRALFARVPILVEGPSDRSVIETFLHALATTGQIPPPAALGLEVISCEGWPDQAPMAGLLAAAGKKPVALVETDVDSLAELRTGNHCGALVVYDESRPNLESELALKTPWGALVSGMTAVVSDRGVDFNEQKGAILAVGDRKPPPDALIEAATFDLLVERIGEAAFRPMAQLLLASESGPFSIKSARSARIFAEAVVAESAVPLGFRHALIRLSRWVAHPERREEISLRADVDSPGS